ncbi:unnamed protein product [Gadus morhua 'NCC']
MQFTTAAPQGKRIYPKTLWYNIVDSRRSVSTQTAGPRLGHSGCGLRDRGNKGRDDVEGTGSSGDYAGQQELQAITEDRLWPQPLRPDSPASPAALDSTVHQPAACHREPG